MKPMKPRAVKPKWNRLCFPLRTMLRIASFVKLGFSPEGGVEGLVIATGSGDFDAGVQQALDEGIEIPIHHPLHVGGFMLGA